MTRDVARRQNAEVDALTRDLPDVPTLQLEDLENETEDALVARGAAYVAEYARIADRPAMLTKNTAAVLVALRLRMDDPLGRSYEYRLRVRDVYAGTPPDKLENIQAAVRYHVGNLLRRHLTAREVEKLELLPTSPAERYRDARAVNAAVVAASRVSTEASSSSRKARKATPDAESAIPEQRRGTPVKATADQLRLATTVATVLGQLDTDVIDEHMTDGQRAKLDAELEAMAKRITALRRHTKKARSKG